MTPEQQALALTAGPVVGYWVNRQPKYLIRALGRDAVEQQAWYGACKAAAKYDADRDRGKNFLRYASRGVRFALIRMCDRYKTNAAAWETMPQDREHGDQPDPPDDRVHRPAGRHPLLRIWCHPDNRRARAHVDLRHRVLLYLWAVEQMSFRDLSAVFGLSKERIGQMIRRAVERVHPDGRTFREFIRSGKDRVEVGPGVELEAGVRRPDPGGLGMPGRNGLVNLAALRKRARGA